MRRLLSLVASLLVPTATALLLMAGMPLHGGAPTELQQLTSLMVGDYQSLPSDGARPGRPIYLRIRQLETAQPNTIALYSEMRHDGPDGELYRQRMYQFEANAQSPFVMQALSFVDPKAATRLIDDPTLLRTQALATQPSMEPGCETRWTRTTQGFLGVIDPATCIITGKRGDQRRIEGQTLFNKEGVGQLERGYDLAGKLLFGNPTGELYVWPRVKR